MYKVIKFALLLGGANTPSGCSVNLDCICNLILKLLTNISYPIIVLGANPTGTE